MRSRWVWPLSIAGGSGVGLDLENNGHRAAIESKAISPETLMNSGGQAGDYAFLTYAVRRFVWA